MKSGSSCPGQCAPGFEAHGSFICERGELIEKPICVAPGVKVISSPAVQGRLDLEGPGSEPDADWAASAAPAVATAAASVAGVSRSDVHMLGWDVVGQERLRLRRQLRMLRQLADGWRASFDFAVVVADAQSSGAAVAERLAAASEAPESFLAHLEDALNATGSVELPEGTSAVLAPPRIVEQVVIDETSMIQSTVAPTMSTTLLNITGIAPVRSPQNSKPKDNENSITIDSFTLSVPTLIGGAAGLLILSAACAIACCKLRRRQKQQADVYEAQEEWGLTADTTDEPVVTKPGSAAPNSSDTSNHTQFDSVPSAASDEDSEAISREYEREPSWIGKEVVATGMLPTIDENAWDSQEWDTFDLDMDTNLMLDAVQVPTLPESQVAGVPVLSRMNSSEPTASEDAAQDEFFDQLFATAPARIRNSSDQAPQDDFFEQLTATAPARNLGTSATQPGQPVSIAAAVQSALASGIIDRSRSLEDVEDDRGAGSTVFDSKSSNSIMARLATLGAQKDSADSTSAASLPVASSTPAKALDEMEEGELLEEFGDNFLTAMRVDSDSDDDGPPPVAPISIAQFTTAKSEAGNSVMGSRADERALATEDASHASGGRDDGHDMFFAVPAPQ